MARRARRRLVGLAVAVAVLALGVMTAGTHVASAGDVDAIKLSLESSLVARHPLAPAEVSVVADFPAVDPTTSSLHNASADYTYNAGNGLARTGPAGSGRLHAIASASRVGTAVVKDAGPYAPISYTRGNEAGSSWTAAQRLNATNQHGLWPGIAAAGESVYASWVKVSKVVSFSPSAARSIQFRSNATAGAGAWSGVKTLTSSTGRVDYPTIAAAGSSVYVAYTDANSGAVRVLISRDRGATWSNVSLGTSSATSSNGGRTGLPTVAASGKIVIVGWIADRNGAVRARVSQDGGAHWGGTANLATASLSYPSAAATNNRAGIAWIGAEPTVALWTQKGRWASPFEVPNVNHAWLEVIYGPALVLNGWSTVGVGYSGCVQVCSQIGTSTHFESYYAESPTNGVDWYNGSSFAVGTGPDGRRGADGLSALASSATKRDFLFTFWQPGTSTQRLVHRSITFTPVEAPTHVIRPLAPTRSGPAPRPTPTRSRLATRTPFRS
jgi:hypothetical protein